MHRRSKLINAIEPLEFRRLFSRWTLDTVIAAGEHNPGCSCGACRGQPADAEAVLEAIQNVQREIQQKPTPENLPAVGGGGAPVAAPEMSANPESAFGAVGAQPTGGLTGKIVYVGGGHGWTINNTGAGNWYTQRGELHEMIEDMGNQDQMAWYANYLWQAGATVVPLRPIGSQLNEVVVDNDDATVSFTGSWSTGASTPWYGTAGDAAPYRSATSSTTETAVATYNANFPAAGFYPVYAWALDGANRATDQLYRVVHSGGSTEVKINHTWVGKGFVYLGSYHFDAGNNGQGVQISNKSSVAGRAIIADAIRFGNGMGQKTNASGVKSNAPREDEQSLYWYDFTKGVGVSEFYRGGNSDDGDANVGAPGRWAAYMNAAPFGQALHLSFHSNAGGGRGTVGLYNDETLFPNTATPNQFQWAKLVGDEVEFDMVALGSPPLEFTWTPRANPIARTDFAFGEIRSSANGDEYDSTILEVAFHDSAQDAAMLRDPKVRNWVGRSSYQATVKYFNQFGGLANNTMLPESPTNVRATTAANGDVTVSWTAPVVDGIGGDAATGYRVYSSDNGYGFDGGVAVVGGGVLSYTIPAAQVPAGGASALYLRVAATNAGGESLPSAVVTTRRSSIANDKVLVINGFDRWDKAGNFRQTTPNSLVIDRVRPRRGNSFDYVVQAGEAIEAFALRQVGFDSATPRALELGQVNLANYSAVIWLAGEQSTANGTFSATNQNLITNFVSAGGDMFVSGSELGFDLDGNNSGRTFYNNVLRADYVQDDANSYAANGSAGGIFAGINLTFDNNTGATYDVDFPDVITTSNSSTIAMTYGTGGAAAVVHDNSATESRVVTMAFPFEAISSAANRNAVMAAVLNFMSSDLIAPTLTSNNFEFQDGQSLTFAFSENVGATLSAADLTVTNLTTAQTLAANQYNLSYNAGNNTAMLTFANLPSGFLDDGNYRVTINAAGVTDPAGNPLGGANTIEFFVFAGDANRNRQVEIGDFGLLAANFNQSPRNFGQGDFNYDDIVNIADFSILASRFNQSLPAARTSSGAAGSLAMSTRPLEFSSIRSSIFGANAIDVLDETELSAADI